MNFSIPKDIICIIPARGGSKGIVNKNLQLIGGIPLVEHSINHALSAGIKPERIYVSSDSTEILDLAKEKGVIDHIRPSEISADTSSTEDALLHVVNSDKLNLCNHVLLLQATSPIRLDGMLNNFMKFYLQNNFDSALTTTKFHNFFWQENNNGIDYDCSYDPVDRPMRQSLGDYDYQYLENGNAYLTSAKILQQKKCRIGDNPGIFPISELEGMQIDTYKELEIFRMIFNGSIADHMK